MSLEYARDLWGRADNALRSAQSLLKISPDDAASRAYYAVFHAVSSVFAMQDRTFTKHSSVRAAVHRDLVKPGIWSVDLGADFDSLWELRDLGDYGGRQHVLKEDAGAAVEAAGRIMDAVRSRFAELEKS